MLGGAPYWAGPDGETCPYCLWWAEREGLSANGPVPADRSLVPVRHAARIYGGRLEALVERLPGRWYVVAHVSAQALFQVGPGRTAFAAFLERIPDECVPPVLALTFGDRHWGHA